MVSAIAIDLRVTTDLVDAYQRLLERIGDRTYLLPHMGAGAVARQSGPRIVVPELPSELAWRVDRI